MTLCVCVCVCGFILVWVPAEGEVCVGVGGVMEGVRAGSVRSVLYATNVYF